MGPACGQAAPVVPQAASLDPLGGTAESRLGLHLEGLQHLYRRPPSCPGSGSVGGRYPFAPRDLLQPQARPSRPTARFLDDPRQVMIERYTFLCCQCPAYECREKPNEGWALPRGWWYAPEVSDRHPCIHNEHGVHQPLYCPNCTEVEPQEEEPPPWRRRHLAQEEMVAGAVIQARFPAVPGVRRYWGRELDPATYLEPDPIQTGWHWVLDEGGQRHMLARRDLYAPAEPEEPNPREVARMVAWQQHVRSRR